LYAQKYDEEFQVKVVKLFSWDKKHKSCSMFNEFNFNYWHRDHGSSAQVQTSPKALINLTLPVTLEFLGIH
jgi:hypothetical protein